MEHAKLAKTAPTVTNHVVPHTVARSTTVTDTPKASSAELGVGGPIREGQNWKTNWSRDLKTLALSAVGASWTLTWDQTPPSLPRVRDISQSNTMTKSAWGEGNSSKAAVPVGSCALFVSVQKQNPFCFVVRAVVCCFQLGSTSHLHNQDCVWPFFLKQLLQVLKKPS